MSVSQDSMPDSLCWCLRAVCVGLSGQYAGQFVAAFCQSRSLVGRLSGRAPAGRHSGQVCALRRGAPGADTRPAAAAADRQTGGRHRTPRAPALASGPCSGRVANTPLMGLIVRQRYFEVERDECKAGLLRALADTIHQPLVCYGHRGPQTPK